VTALLGVVVGLPSLRVKGLYLAIATLAAHFILTFIFREWEAGTGGVAGTAIPGANLFGFEFAGDRRNFYLIFVCAFIMAVAARNLARTHIGRALVAVRDRDISAEILGVNLLRTKLLAFAVGRVLRRRRLAACSATSTATSPRLLRLTLSVFYLAAVIVGGLGTVLGSVLGAVFMTFVPEALRLIAQAARPGFPALPGCCCRCSRSCSACSSSAF
jgi:branched-chain amino acid transport system permease protein